MKPLAVLLVLLSLILSGCRDTINGKATAEPAVAGFREKMKAHDYEAIYSNAAAEFRSATPKEKVLALFAAIDRKLGPIKESTLVNWNVNTFNNKTHAVMVYSSKFAEGDATETFTYRVDDQRAVLVGYNIASLDMLIK